MIIRGVKNLAGIPAAETAGGHASYWAAVACMFPKLQQLYDQLV